MSSMQHSLSYRQFAIKLSRHISDFSNVVSTEFLMKTECQTRNDHKEYLAAIEDFSSQKRLNTRSHLFFCICFSEFIILFCISDFFFPIKLNVLAVSRSDY